MYPQRLPRWTCWTVPVVDTEMEARPMTLEEMEDVGKPLPREEAAEQGAPADGEGRGLGDRVLGPPAPRAPPSGRGALGVPASSLPSLCEQHLPPKVSDKMSWI